MALVCVHPPLDRLVHLLLPAIAVSDFQGGLKHFFYPSADIYAFLVVSDSVFVFPTVSVAIGEIEITTVESKMSQAKIISGNNLITQKFSSGLIVRSIPKPAAAPAVTKPKKKNDNEW